MKKIIVCIFLSIFIFVQYNIVISGAYIVNKTDHSEVLCNDFIFGNISAILNKEVNTPKIVSITHEKGYIFGMKGIISAKQVKFVAKMQDFTRKIIDGDKGRWYFSNTDIAKYSNGEITILNKGITRVTVVIEGAATRLLLFAKESAEDSYVLYEENFNSLSNYRLPQEWTRKDGAHGMNSYVKDGAFFIDARLNPVRVFLPDYLGEFGNYTIEADVTNLYANDEMRWNSIMYRIQNDDYPYYQMSVRKKATVVNGTEFAERDNSNCWIVGKTNFYYEDINESKMYHYKVNIYDNIVQHWIGNVMLMNLEIWNKYSVGKIGFQADGSVMKIDNIKVSLLENPLTLLNSPKDNFTKVSEADTKIAMAPTVVTEIKNKKEFESLIADGQAATAILSVNKRLEITGYGSNSVIGTVDSCYEKMKTNIMPAFRVNDSDSAKVLSEYLKDKGIEDVFVISKYPEFVKMAREIYPFVRGIIEFENMPSSLDENQLMNIRNYANSNLSRIVVLPMEVATKNNIRYLQQRLITVWIKDTTKENDSEKIVTLHKIITAGTNGILTQSPDKAVEALSFYNNNTTIIRKPFLIGHRGVPHLAPENTIEGSKLAFELGADTVENDVWLTKAGVDGKQHVVVMHDGTLERTTNGVGKVSEKTLEQISTYFANRQFANKYATAKIPTLSQYFETFRKKDQTIFVEIKSKDPKTVNHFVELIKRVGAYEQAIAISSSDDQLKRTKALMPEISLGNVRGGYDYKTDIYECLRFVLWEVQSLDSSLMPNCESISRDFMEIAKHRGMTIWPWAINDKNKVIEYFKMGAWGISTDCAYVLSDWAVDITPKHSQIYMKNGETSLIEASIKTYKGTVKNVKAEVVVLSGEEYIEVKDNNVLAKEPGTAYIILRYTASLSKNINDVYDIYSEPLRIQVQ